MSYDNVPPLPEHIAKQLASQKHEMDKYQSHPTFLCLEAGMKEDTRLPFVQILNAVIHPYPGKSEVTESFKGPPKEVQRV